MRYNAKKYEKIGKVAGKYEEHAAETIERGLGYEARKSPKKFEKTANLMAKNNVVNFIGKYKGDEASAVTSDILILAKYHPNDLSRALKIAGGYSKQEAEKILTHLANVSGKTLPSRIRRTFDKLLEGYKYKAKPAGRYEQKAKPTSVAARHKHAARPAPSLPGLAKGYKPTPLGGKYASEKYEKEIGEVAGKYEGTAAGTIGEILRSSKTKKQFENISSLMKSKKAVQAISPYKGDEAMDAVADITKIAEYQPSMFGKALKIIGNYRGKKAAKVREELANSASEPSSFNKLLEKYEQTIRQARKHIAERHKPAAGQAPAAPKVPGYEQQINKFADDMNYTECQEGIKNNLKKIAQANKKWLQPALEAVGSYTSDEEALAVSEQLKIVGLYGPESKNFIKAAELMKGNEAKQAVRNYEKAVSPEVARFLTFTALSHPERFNDVADKMKSDLAKGAIESYELKDALGKIYELGETAKDRPEEFTKEAGLMTERKLMKEGKTNFSGFLKYWSYKLKKLLEI